MTHHIGKYGDIENFCRADSRLAPSQWETSIQSNAVSHWLGANLESALLGCCIAIIPKFLQQNNWGIPNFTVPNVPIFQNTPEIIMDTSGKGHKVWKSEVIGPAVIVDTGSGPQVGSFRVDSTGSKQTNYTKICFNQKPNNTIRVQISLCKFWGPWVHRVI